MNEETCVNNFYDQAYLINLDRSQKRLKDFTDYANKANIDFLRWPATDLLNISVTNLSNNVTMSSRYLKENKIKISYEKTKYLVSCEPEKQNGTEFYFDMSKNRYVPGELALWCSNVKIWQDAKIYGYKNIVIFEDDVKFKNPALVKDNINNFI